MGAEKGLRGALGAVRRVKGLGFGGHAEQWATVRRKGGAFCGIQAYVPRVPRVTVVGMEASAGGVEGGSMRMAARQLQPEPPGVVGHECRQSEYPKQQCLQA